VGGDRSSNIAAPGAGAELRMCLLGRIEARAGDEVVIDGSWPRRKVFALLKLVALQPDRALHREQVFDVLWPDLTPTAAARNLRKSLHHLRSVFAAHGVDAPVVCLAGEMVVLCPDVRLDIDEFKERARKARTARTDPTFYEQALSLYVGDLLPEDLYQDWAQPARDELRSLRSRLLSELCDLWEQRGELEPAIDRLQELLRADPVNETAHRSLMRLHSRDASRERALRQYESCRAILERELGVKPSEETEALRLEIAEGRPPPRRVGRTVPDP
jgi:DNA-binding SARP family transcriptional activator